jgi:hypothetical protein
LLNRSDAQLDSPAKQTSSQATSQEQSTGQHYEQKKLAQKFNENSIKSTALEPKIYTDAIQPSTKLLPKNHCSRLTQTPGKSDRSKNEKEQKQRTKIID